MPTGGSESSKSIHSQGAKHYVLVGRDSGLFVCLFPSERDGASVLEQITSISIEPGVDVEVTINDSQ